ncbi:uncharacterized protein EI90DRAFT_3066909 [Cantharellus anzutake]|uniref:uncharacterized protein n=1 Tax=Cantharellus anzutake TaxID=1750568 RepID=UPI001906AA97|nr:uncharacterized protein EI90DRAFT_3066909 [Cantharellus anzutake]KAF8327753.1 hypothetical protein EI90DRAFT_3066909 [Cantharellus anzutake]
MGRKYLDKTASPPNVQLLLSQMEQKHLLELAQRGEQQVMPHPNDVHVPQTAIPTPPMQFRHSDVQIPGDDDRGPGNRRPRGGNAQFALGTPDATSTTPTCIARPYQPFWQPPAPEAHERQHDPEDLTSGGVEPSNPFPPHLARSYGDPQMVPGLTMTSPSALPLPATPAPGSHQRHHIRYAATRTEAFNPPPATQLTWQSPSTTAPFPTCPFSPGSTHTHHWHQYHSVQPPSQTATYKEGEAGPGPSTQANPRHRRHEQYRYL